MTTTPNIQYMVNGEAVILSSLQAQLESGLVRIPVISGELLYSQGTKSITVTCECPVLPDGLQIDAFGLIIKGQECELGILIGGDLWTGKGHIMNSEFGQSADAGQSQSVVIECPLNNEPG